MTHPHTSTVVTVQGSLGLTWCTFGGNWVCRASTPTNHLDENPSSSSLQPRPPSWSRKPQSSEPETQSSAALKINHKVWAALSLSVAGEATLISFEATDAIWGSRLTAGRKESIAAAGSCKARLWLRGGESVFQVFCFNQQSIAGISNDHTLT